MRTYVVVTVEEEGGAEASGLQKIQGLGGVGGGTIVKGQGNRARDGALEDGLSGGNGTARSWSGNGSAAAGCRGTTSNGSTAAGRVGTTGDGRDADGRKGTTRKRNGSAAANRRNATGAGSDSTVDRVGSMGGWRESAIDWSGMALVTTASGVGVAAGRGGSAAEQQSAAEDAGGGDTHVGLEG